MKSLKEVLEDIGRRWQLIDEAKSRPALRMLSSREVAFLLDLNDRGSLREMVAELPAPELAELLRIVEKREAWKARHAAR